MQEKAPEKHDVQRKSADVIIIDSLPPQESAMSQAIYSRKPKSILYTLSSVLQKGAKTFMSTFYSGYGHNSIGDCGTVTLHFENISMLAAKAIQAHPLYSGQEASTRYLDFSGRIMINPLAGQLAAHYLYIPKEKINEHDMKNIDDSFVQKFATDIAMTAGETGQMIQKKWMAFYEKNMPVVKAYVESLNPPTEGTDLEQYAKAVNARAFDIMRAFIPAGMTTLASRHTNIRQIRDHLAVMKYHPTEEIARVAKTALEGLRGTYPESFPNKEYPETEAYLKQKAESVSYFKKYRLEGSDDDFYINDELFDRSRLIHEYSDLVRHRPAKNELPHEIGETGIIRVAFHIDFGSYRDVQRHRKGVCKMPLLTTGVGFHQWYLDRLPAVVREEALALIKELTPIINSLPCSDEDRQYYIPMGFMVLADFSWTFDQCVYVAELRSGETVHPTLRIHAQRLGKWIEKHVPESPVYVDYSEDKWSYKRGAQDINEKSAVV